MVCLAASQHGPIGATVLLANGEEMVLGRSSDRLGERCFDDTRVSRDHAALRIDAQGQCHVEDRGSRNGTQLNGHRVKSARLTSGDVVGIGGSLICVTLAPADWRPRPDPWLVGVGPCHTALVDAVDRVAAQDAPVLVVGESGTGKDFIVHALHRRAGRPGPLITVHCGALPDDAVHRELFSPGGLIDASAGGSFYLDGIDDASPQLQGALLGFVETRKFRRIGATTTTTVDTRILASCLVEPEQTPLRDDFIARLAQWVIRLPSLDQRREDIPLFARAFADAFGHGPTPLHAKLVLSLLRGRWRGHLRGLRAEVERAIVAANGVRPVPLPREPIPTTREEEPSSQIVEVGDAGGWFRCGDAVVELAHRPSLARLLHGLLQHHDRDPSRVLTPLELVELGWPDEQVKDQAGINRVYVAISTLRKLGLRDVIAKTRSGYRLDPSTEFRITDRLVDRR